MNAMKKTGLIVIISFMYLAVFAQQGPADRLFDKYSGQEGFTSVYISKYMFSLFATTDEKDEDYDEVQNALGKLTSIKILAMEDKIEPAVNFYREIEKDLPLDEYQELMVVKEKDQDFKFLAREKNGQISELLMIGGGKDNVLILIQGDIDLKTISKLSKSMEIEGMKNLEKLEEK